MNEKEKYIPVSEIEKINKGNMLVSDSKYKQERLVGVLETTEGLKSFSTPINRNKYGIKQRRDNKAL